MSDNYVHTLPKNWTTLEIGGVQIYINLLDFSISSTVPFNLAGIEAMFKTQFNRKLIVDTQSIITQVKLLKAKIEPEVKNFPSFDMTQHLMQKARENELSKSKVERKRKACQKFNKEIITFDNKSELNESFQLSKHAMESVSLKDLKTTAKDIISLFHRA